MRVGNPDSHLVSADAAGEGTMCLLRTRPIVRWAVGVRALLSLGAAIPGVLLTIPGGAV